MSAPWLRSQSPVRTPWERGGTPWALLGNATVAVGAPWHLHVMGNVKLFAIFFSIFVRSHGALGNVKSPCQRRGIAVECDRGLTHWSYCSLAQSHDIRDHDLKGWRIDSLWLIHSWTRSLLSQAVACLLSDAKTLPKTNDNVWSLGASFSEIRIKMSKF